MFREATWRRGFGLLVVGVVAVGVALAAHGVGLLGWLERPTIDARFSLRGGERPPSNVVVVGIDDESLHLLPRYPFSRALHARVIDRLHAAGARVIVEDVSFDKPGEGDEALFEAVARAAPVIFATSTISSTGATDVMGGGAARREVGAIAAAAELLPDSDGVLRHTLGQVRGLPTIAAAVRRELTGSAAIGAQPGGGWIDFPGPPGSVRTLSFAKVLGGRFDPAAVRGEIVVIGASAPLLQDLHSTSVGAPMTGPEVQAAAISTALSGFPLRSPSGVVIVLVIIALGLLVPLAGIRLETAGVAVLGLAALAAYSLAVQLAFDSGVVLDYSDPMAALALGGGGAVLAGMWSDGRERRRLRLLFAAGQPSVVDRVLQGGPRPLEPTSIIAGYRIEEAIARGGMGVVYRATQLELDRMVALKLIASERAQDPVFRARFKLESRLAASIEHVNVIPVYEAGEDDGLLFIAMRLVNGTDLAQLLDEVGALEPTRAARLIAQLAGALDAAHGRGLVHRDVKPANALLTLDQPEHLYLTDFGVAKHIGGSPDMTTEAQWVGTIDYLAPEQIRGDAVGAAADIYSLACVLYECLTGEIPFPRENQAAKLWAHINAPPPLPSQSRQGLPAALDEVIARGMAKDPAGRYPTAAQLAQTCARALGIITPAAETHAPQAAGKDAGAEREPHAPTVISE